MRMNFELIQLPYAQDALEPAISAETIGFHHGKHLQTYVQNLNALLPGTPYEDMSLEEIVTQSDGAIFNNAGQILNHNLYFTQFATPREGNKPTGRIGKAIDTQFGSFDAFKEEFENDAVWLRLGVAGGRQRRQVAHNAGGERRQPHPARAEATADIRRVGTRLLLGLPEPTRRSPRRPVADSELGRGGTAV